MALTHGPMPRVPDARRLSLHVCTALVTDWPQLVGFKLPVTATSVATPAAAAAKAATATRVASLRPSAAPAPPSSLFVKPPEIGVLRGGMGAAEIGSRIRCSSRSSSSSNSPAPFIGKKEQAPGRIYPKFFCPARG